MIKYYFSLFLFFISFVPFGAQETPRFNVSPTQSEILSHIQVRSVLANYQRGFLVGELRNFVSKSRPSRLYASTGHLKAREYLKKRIKELDNGEGTKLFIQSFSPDFESAIDFYRHNFKQNVASVYSSESKEYKEYKAITNSIIEQLKSFKEKELSGENIIWYSPTKNSSPSHGVIVVGAHYDSTLFDEDSDLFVTKESFDGADKNASGVAAGLSSIEILSQLNLNHDVLVVFLDLHEWRQLGVKYFAQSLPELLSELGRESSDNTLEIFIDLFALAHRSFEHKDSSARLNLVYAPEDSSFHRPSMEVAQQFRHQMQLGRFGSRVELRPGPYAMTGADYFWNKSMHAIALTHDFESDPNPRMHTPNDFIETLDLLAFDQNFRSIMAGIIGYSLNLTN